MMVGAIGNARHAPRIGAGLTIEPDRSATGQDQPVPGQQDALLPHGYFAVIVADQPGTLRNEENANRRAIVDILGHLRRDLSGKVGRSEEHTSELQTLMRISYAVICLKQI